MLDETSINSQTDSSTINEFVFDTTIDYLNASTSMSFVRTTNNQIAMDLETIILSDYNSTISDDDNVDTTITLDTVPNDTTFMQDEITDTAIISNNTQNDTTVNNQDIDDTMTIVSEDLIQNSTSIMIIDENEYPIERRSSVPTTMVKLSCDLQCQCTQKCPYGYEIINDTCECDSPCKVSNKKKRED